ncbi:hypothetical protein Taro_051823 [Colocasia esculenta]|uniref:Uncharacterized protein n=1 Tax=Colocasia esculenta TaxID=4460 RepID=A0A843XHK7_COLES|nr:hypothetical protein [Colocasia esculenta]
MWTSGLVNVKGACLHQVVSGHRCCRLHGIRGKSTNGQMRLNGPKEPCGRWAKSRVYSDLNAAALLDMIPGIASVTRGTGFRLSSDRGDAFKGFKRGVCPGRDFSLSVKSFVLARQSRGGSVRRRGRVAVASPAISDGFWLPVVRAAREPCEDDTRIVGVPSVRRFWCLPVVTCSALVVGRRTPVVDTGPQLVLFQCLTLGFSAEVPKGIRLEPAGCVTCRLWWLVSLHCSWLVVVERQLDLPSVTGEQCGPVMPAHLHCWFTVWNHGGGRRRDLNAAALLDAIPGTASVTRGTGFHLASDRGDAFKGFKHGVCPERDFVRAAREPREDDAQSVGVPSARRFWRLPVVRSHVVASSPYQLVFDYWLWFVCEPLVKVNVPLVGRVVLGYVSPTTAGVEVRP